MIYVYDIEVYQNYFSVIFKDVRAKKLYDFIIFEDRNDLYSLHKFISSNKKSWLIGYNSFHFDNQILNYIYKFFPFIREESTNSICQSLYNLANRIISDDLMEYKYRLPFKSIDLMRVGNIDQKSLKLVAVNLEWPVIQDLPISNDKLITKEDLPLLYEYNLNDVNITEQLYEKLKDKIKVRYDITEYYKIDVMSEPDSGMANRLMEKLYTDASGIPISQLKKLRTERKIIHYENIIFDNITFKTDILKNMLSELKTKKFYKNQPFFKKDIVFNGVKYQLGIGGLHSDDRPGIFKADNNTKIIDCDITSFYPNILINYNLFPAHLGETFLMLYKRLVHQRVEAKEKGDTSRADVLKICVNSVFGKTLFEHHWLYDPLVGLRTTINGQLFLLSLIERLVLAGFEVTSANTDGIITIVPKDKEDLYKDVCKEWSKDTSFNLEYTEYEAYIRTSVNDYIAVKSVSEGKTKEKGIFLQKDRLSLMQGIDKPIIANSLYNYFIHGKQIEDTIYSSTNIYDFCIAKKSDKKFINEFHYLKDGKHIIDKLQKSVRFYISTDGGTLFKVDKQDNNKYINYCVGRKVSILNDNKVHKDIRDYNIDYGYYIKETQKLIDEVINPQLKLF